MFRELGQNWACAEALTLARDLKDYCGVTWGVERLAEVAEKLGQLDRAARFRGSPLGTIMGREALQRAE